MKGKCPCKHKKKGKKIPTPRAKLQKGAVKGPTRKKNPYNGRKKK